MRLRCENICKSFNGSPILRNVTLESDPSHFLVVMGPNGSGKTTLLRVIALLEKPESGKVFYEDKEAEFSNTEARRNCAFVFQNPILLDRSVRENILYGAKKRKIGFSEEKIKWISESLGLEKLMDRMSRTLSGGERKRVMIAMAIMCDPKILILDEPFANLDFLSSRIVEDFLFAIKNRKNKTVILSTHDLSKATLFGDKIVILKNGEVVKETTKDELLTSNFDFYANPSRNILSVLIKERNSTAYAKLPNGYEIEVLTSIRGKATISIPPSSIIVSLNEILSSARIWLKGTIANIVEENDFVLISADVGFLLDSIITKKSFKEMNLFLGKEIYLTIKSSSIIVFKENADEI